MCVAGSCQIFTWDASHARDEDYGGTYLACVTIDHEHNLIPVAAGWDFRAEKYDSWAPGALQMILLGVCHVLGCIVTCMIRNAIVHSNVVRC